MFKSPGTHPTTSMHTTHNKSFQCLSATHLKSLVKIRCVRCIGLPPPRTPPPHSSIHHHHLYACMCMCPTCRVGRGVVHCPSLSLFGGPEAPPREESMARLLPPPQARQIPKPSVSIIIIYHCRVCCSPNRLHAHAPRMLEIASLHRPPHLVCPPPHLACGLQRGSFIPVCPPGLVSKPQQPRHPHPPSLQVPGGQVHAPHKDRLHPSGKTAVQGGSRLPYAEHLLGQVAAAAGPRPSRPLRAPRREAGSLPALQFFHRGGSTPVCPAKIYQS